MKMSADDIKDGFNNLTKERKKLTVVLHEKIDVGSRCLKFWNLFVAECTIAESYQSDDRKELKLKLATRHLDVAKNDVLPYGVNNNAFLMVEEALKSVINSITKLNASAEKYKEHSLNIRQEFDVPVRNPSLGG